MNTFIISLLLLIMVGINFCSPENGFMENEADQEVARNPFGCLLNFIGLVVGFGTCLTAAIYFSITENWWIFLLFIPGFILASIVKKILCKIIPFNKITNSNYDSYVTQAVIKKEIGALLVILSYVIYFIFR